MKVVVSDIEGCLNRNERTYDHDALAWIRLANQLASVANPIPFVTVLTGRQHAFVDAICRMLSVRLPAIFEGGCGMFFPSAQLIDEYEWHPLLSEPKTSSEFAAVHRVISDLCSKTGARRVIGKEVLLTLHPPRTITIGDLEMRVRETLEKAGLSPSVSPSASAVDIAPAGIDKGVGFAWLIDRLGSDFPIDSSQAAGIGDSAGDLAFLRRSGFSAAVANAAPEVKTMASYCSPLSDGKGVVDIIGRCIRMNLEE
jgi:hydroxymethylpyrimidine pyrophosphatase-like HAD family hydrolase